MFPSDRHRSPYYSKDFFLQPKMRLERNIARHPLFQVTKVWFDFFFVPPSVFFWSFQPPSFFLVRGDGVSGVDNISGCRIKKHAVNPVDASAHGVNVVMNKCRWLTSTNHPWRINGSFLNPVITNRQCLSSPEGKNFCSTDSEPSRVLLLLF